MVECQLCDDCLTIIGTSHSEDNLKTHLARLMAEHVKNEHPMGAKWVCLDESSQADMDLLKQIKNNWVVKIKLKRPRSVTGTRMSRRRRLKRFHLRPEIAQTL